MKQGGFFKQAKVSFKPMRHYLLLEFEIANADNMDTKRKKWVVEAMTNEMLNTNDKREAMTPQLLQRAPSLITSDGGQSCTHAYN